MKLKKSVRYIYLNKLVKRVSKLCGILELYRQLRLRDDSLSNEMVISIGQLKYEIKLLLPLTSTPWNELISKELDSISVNNEKQNLKVAKALSSIIQGYISAEIEIIGATFKKGISDADLKAISDKYLSLLPSS
jgi:hypothetical protein